MRAPAMQTGSTRRGLSTSRRRAHLYPRPFAGAIVADHLDHIADKSGLIASLPTNDPQRKLAEKHARICAPCREALEDGSRLVAMLRREISPSQTRERPIRNPSAPAIDTEVDATSRRLAWVTVGAAAVA